MTQVQSLDLKLCDTERRLQEMVNASHRQTSLAQSEVRIEAVTAWLHSVSSAHVRHNYVLSSINAASVIQPARKDFD